MSQPKGLASTSAHSRLSGIEDWGGRNSPSLEHAGLMAEGKERWCSHEWVLSLLLRNGSTLTFPFQGIPQLGASNDLQIYSMMQEKAHGRRSGIRDWGQSPGPDDSSCAASHSAPTHPIHPSTWSLASCQIANLKTNQINNSSCYQKDMCPSLSKWNPFALA